MQFIAFLSRLARECADFPLILGVKVRPYAEREREIEHESAHEPRLSMRVAPESSLGMFFWQHYAEPRKQLGVRLRLAEPTSASHWIVEEILYDDPSGPEGPFGMAVMATAISLGFDQFKIFHRSDIDSAVQTRHAPPSILE